MTQQIVDPGTGEVLDLPMDDEILLRVFEAVQKEVTYSTHKLGLLEQEIHRRLRERGADKIYGKGMEYEDTSKPDPNRSKIPALMEYLTPDEVVKCLAPAHWDEPKEPEWIEDKYDLTQVKKAIKDHGGEAQTALDAIYIPGAPKGRLVIKE